jgi:hypothetical protein
MIVALILTVIMFQYSGLRKTGSVLRNCSDQGCLNILYGIKFYVKHVNIEKR